MPRYTVAIPRPDTSSLADSSTSAGLSGRPVCSNAARIAARCLVFRVTTPHRFETLKDSPVDSAPHLFTRGLGVRLAVGATPMQNQLLALKPKQLGQQLLHAKNRAVNIVDAIAARTLEVMVPGKPCQLVPNHTPGSETRVSWPRRQAPGGADTPWQFQDVERRDGRARGPRPRQAAVPFLRMRPEPPAAAALVGGRRTGEGMPLSCPPSDGLPRNHDNDSILSLTIRPRNCLPRFRT